MAIPKLSVEKFISPFEGFQGEGKISLFIVSKTNSGLKRLNLVDFSLAGRKEQLKLWSEENQLVLVIEKGDVVFAHVHANYVDQLKQGNALSLEGKKVTVKALSDEEMAEIAEAAEECLLSEEEVNTGESETEKEKLSAVDDSQLPRYQYVSKHREIGGEIVTRFLVDQLVKRNLGQLISDCIKRFQEAREELKKQQESDDKKDRILRGELKKELDRGEVKKEEIQRKEIKNQ